GLDYQIRKEMGADLELVGKDRLHEIEPALSSEFNAAVLVKGQARMRSPGRLGQVLAQKAKRLGAVFKRTKAHRIERLAPEGWKVHCDDGPLQTHRVVLAFGAWSPDLLAGLGISVPLLAERGYHVEFAEPGIEIHNSVMDVDAKVVASSMEGGVRIAGQAEFAPVDAPPTKRREQQLVKVARAAFPDLRTEERRFWMGRRPSFPDSLPAIGAVPNQPGLFANFGHSHYGLMMAPKSGEVLASLLCNEHQNVDLGAYALDRF
ncbi:MAG: FAD-binding oxidoreductase, partial [Pseudomonadota bacterium]